MSDVTFGVKVPEEMKNELSDLMKDSTVSGKEFMGMLLASYKLEKLKEEDSLFDSDLKELQGLIKRIQSIFINMIDKSTLNFEEQQKITIEHLKEIEKEKESLHQIIEEQKEAIKVDKEKEKEAEEQIKQLKKQLVTTNEEILDHKQQLKNQHLLHTKFEDEVKRLNEKLESYKRLEGEIQERNDECTKLKNRNDELASESWFLQREIEKLNEEKKQLVEKQEKEIEQLKLQHTLHIKNQLLEQKLILKEEVSELQEKVAMVKEENVKLERQYHEKVQEIYNLMKK